MTVNLGVVDVYTS